MRQIQLCIVAFCAALATARAETYGPQVDVTLHNGDSTRGQLVSYTDGSLTIKLDNGNLVTQDGAAVATVRFLATSKPAVAPPPLPSSQETELTMGEEQRMTMYRRREVGVKNLVTGNTPKPLTKEDSADYAKLRTKLELHIKALENEIPKVTTEEAVRDKLNDLARSQILYGMNLGGGELKGVLHTTVLSIKNDELRKKFNFEEYWMLFANEHRKKQFEKMRANEKNMQNPEIRPTAPQPPDKNPLKPPANSKDAF